jgi:hypothetical protein
MIFQTYHWSPPRVAMRLIVPIALLSTVGASQWRAPPTHERYIVTQAAVLPSEAAAVCSLFGATLANVTDANRDAVVRAGTRAGTSALRLRVLVGRAVYKKRYPDDTEDVLDLPAPNVMRLDSGPNAIRIQNPTDGDVLPVVCVVAPERYGDACDRHEQIMAYVRRLKIPRERRTRPTYADMAAALHDLVLAESTGDAVAEALFGCSPS